LTRGAVSERFPYVELSLIIDSHRIDAWALIDTGFDGSISIPQETIPVDLEPDFLERWTLADGFELMAPAFYCTVEVGNLEPVAAVVIVLGNETLVGRSLTDRYRVIFDHGTRVVIEP
jgi:predicted aspartyl protease